MQRSHCPARPRLLHLALLIVFAGLLAAPATGQEITRTKLQRYAYLSGLMAGAALKCNVAKSKAQRFVRMRGYVVGRLSRKLQERGEKVTRSTFQPDFRKGITTARGRRFDCAKVLPAFNRTYEKVEKVAGRHVPR